MDGMVITGTQEPENSLQHHDGATGEGKRTRKESSAGGKLADKPKTFPPPEKIHKKDHWFQINAFISSQATED